MRRTKKLKMSYYPRKKNDISDFLKNEVKQKINLLNQEEYQTVVDHKLITNLERVIEFLKSEILTENEIIKKLLDNDIHQNENCNTVRETWNFDVTHAISDSQSTCSASNSEGSIVKTRDMNTVNTGSKLQAFENTKNIKNPKQLSDPQSRKENLNQTTETKKEFYWPSSTCTIIGDSMINGIGKKSYRNITKKNETYLKAACRVRVAYLKEQNHYFFPSFSK